MTDSLDVFMYGYRIATLQRLAVEEYVLEYDEEWSSADESVSLSLSLPLSRRQHGGKTLSNFLDNLLPDSPDVRQRWATDAGLDTVEPYFLLQEYGQDVAGAASFRPAGAAEFSTRQAITEDEIATRIALVRQDNTAWHDDRLPAPGQFSLGGAQAKFSLARHGGRWFETAGADGSTHLFKPQVRDVPDGELIEYLVMRTAYFLGIPTATVDLFTHGGQHALIVERFDRRVEGGSTVRLHQEDMLQALGQPRLRKFEKYGGPSIDAISGLIARTADDDSLQRYVAMLLFSWIVLSSDAHAKNYSVFVEADGAKLTPLYDASSVLPYLNNDLTLDLPSLLERAGNIELAVRYGGGYLARDIARFELDSIARRCRVDPQDLLARVAVQLLEISDVMADVASDMPTDLQTATVARAVAWMPIRAKQAAEALDIGGVL